MQVVKNRIISRIRKIFSVWIFVQIGFVFSANLGDIIITEFFYKSAGNNYEYIQLYNILTNQEFNPKVGDVSNRIAKNLELLDI